MISYKKGWSQYRSLRGACLTRETRHEDKPGTSIEHFELAWTTSTSVSITCHLLLGLKVYGLLGGDVTDILLAARPSGDRHSCLPQGLAAKM